MGNPPFEDVFPIENGDFPLLCLFTGGYLIYSHILCFDFLPSAFEAKVDNHFDIVRR